MAEEIKDVVGVVPELIKGDGGVFDVVVDGKLIFSKKQVGRFPEHHEILNQIKS